MEKRLEKLIPLCGMILLNWIYCEDIYVEISEGRFQWKALKQFLTPQMVTVLRFWDHMERTPNLCRPLVTSVTLSCFPGDKTGHQLTSLTVQECQLH